LLTEEEKERIRQEHRILLAKRMQLQGEPVSSEPVETDRSDAEETNAILREEEDKFYGDKPDYVKVKDRHGNVRWMLRSEFEQKRFRKYKVRKKRKHRSTRKLLERLSVILIILAMIIITIVALRTVT